MRFLEMKCRLHGIYKSDYDGGHSFVKGNGIPSCLHLREKKSRQPHEKFKHNK